MTTDDKWLWIMFLLGIAIVCGAILTEKYLDNQRTIELAKIQAERTK